MVRLSADDGSDSKYPDLAFSGDRAALTWFDVRDGNEEVYLLVAPVADLKEGMERRAGRVTSTPGESIGAYLAWNGSHLGLAWCHDTDGGQHEIYFQRLDAAGEGGRRAAAPDTQSDVVAHPGHPTVARRLCHCLERVHVRPA